ncbi:hypothetical protein [Arsukibacterium sp.]|uniref:hypothetical protein n=1 Tax=Arsukibacterium sp. TaxID=1977258 RepID=UPI002FDAB12F
MFDTEEKPAAFSAQYSEPADITENETAEWNVAEQLAGGVVVAGASVDTSQELSEVEFSMADVLSPAIQLTADMLAPNWAITEEESQALGGVWGQVIEVWLPGATLDPKWAALGLAAATTAVIAKSRAGVPMRKPKVEKREEKEVNASE